MQHRIRAASLLLLVLAVLAGASLVLYSWTTDITEEFPRPPLDPAGTPARVKPVLYVGVVSRYPPPVIYHGYQPIMDYLTERTPYRFELRPAGSYQEAVDMLVRGETAAAFLGTYIYVRAHEQSGVRAILKPLNENGEPLSRSVLITRSTSPVRTVKDLAGKRLALPSQDSFSGNWLPLAEFPRAGFTSATMPMVQHFSHHQSVVYQVLRGTFDAGVVKERVAREFANRDIRIVLSSSPIPGSPLVVGKDCDSVIVRNIQSALLSIDVRRAADRELVSQWDQEFRYGFAPATEQDFDAIRGVLHGRGGRRP
jgi:phosphonate transport system substrate-binding protein